MAYPAQRTIDQGREPKSAVQQQSDCPRRPCPQCPVLLTTRMLHQATKHVPYVRGARIGFSLGGYPRGGWGAQRARRIKTIDWRILFCDLTRLRARGCIWMRRWIGATVVMKHGLLRSVDSRERDCRLAVCRCPKGGRYLTGYEQYGCDIAVRAITVNTAPPQRRALVSGFNLPTVPVPEIAVEAGPRFSGSIPCFCPGG